VNDVSFHNLGVVKYNSLESRTLTIINIIINSGINLINFFSHLKLILQFHP